MWELVQELHRLEKQNWPARVRFEGATAEVFFQMAGENFEAAKIPAKRALALAQRASFSMGVFVTRDGLASLELATGHAAEAVRLGFELVQELDGPRWQCPLASARVNLVAALIAQGTLAEARSMAEAGWTLSKQFDQMHLLVDHLALLAALEGRMRCTARLLGFGDSLHTEGPNRQRNEARAADRAGVLAREQLGHTEFARLQAEGAAMDDVRIKQIAFAIEDS